MVRLRPAFINARADRRGQRGGFPSRVRVTRSVAMVMELLGPSQAMRKAERAATEAGAERALRARIGKRTPARERQRESAAATREAAPASGHAAVRFAAAMDAGA